MPAARAAIIVNSILDAIQRSGGSGAYISPILKTHPRHFAVQYLDQSFTVWVYIWTLTHGGRDTLPNEFRVQMTTVTPPLQMNPNGPTVLMGYFPDLDMLAGFDIEQHRNFTPGSSSVQISLETFHKALRNGLAFSIKENEEIAIAIRPDQFLNYVFNVTDLHKNGIDNDTFKLLESAASLKDIPSRKLESLSPARQKIITRVQRYARSANFRDQVLGAYDSRCAVTRSQLKLVDAAHILPVAAPGSSDNVTNGLALSPTLHRAYDNCLVYLDKKYKMRLNAEKADELIKLGRHGGLNELKSLLDIEIHLPADKRQWPDPDFIRQANKFRRISTK